MRPQGIVGALIEKREEALRMKRYGEKGCVGQDEPDEVSLQDGVRLDVGDDGRE